MPVSNIRWRVVANGWDGDRLEIVSCNREEYYWQYASKTKKEAIKKYIKGLRTSINESLQDIEETRNLMKKAEELEA